MKKLERLRVGKAAADPDECRAVSQGVTVLLKDVMGEICEPVTIIL